MMRFESGFEEPHINRARNSAATIGIAYVVGGFVPLTACFLTQTPIDGLKLSSILTIICCRFWFLQKQDYWTRSFHPIFESNHDWNCRR
jgi:hypothetical protein